MVKIFDVNEGNITINENCLLIPELKAIIDNYDDPIPVLGYIHFISDPKSPYANLSPEQKEEIVLQDYEGDYTPDDEPVYKAVDKMKLLYETPSMRLLRRARGGMENLGEYIERAKVTEGKDGNLPGLINALKSIARINQEFKSLSLDVEEELRVRGQGNLGYDEI